MATKQWLLTVVLIGVVWVGTAVADMQCCDCRTFCVERPVTSGCGKCTVKAPGACPTPCGTPPKLTRPIRKPK